MSNDVPKVERQLLDRHAKLRDQFGEAFAAVETSDAPDDSAKGKKLVARRDRIEGQLKKVADQLRERGYELEHFDSEPHKVEQPVEEQPPKRMEWRFDNVAEFTDWLVEAARQEGIEADDLDEDALTRLGGEIHQAGEIKTLPANRPFPNKAFIADVKHALEMTPTTVAAHAVKGDK